jgi:7-carboxy-7-deazaguanine synthase
MKINLVENGIFPIKGNLKEDSTGLSFPGTIQGEGKLIGTSCLFIRTSACNLRCAWIGADGNGSLCDTPYSSHKPEKNIMEIDDIIEIVIDNTQPYNIRHIVISGGEPTMQTEALEELVERLSFLEYHITIETNATIFSEKLAKFVNLVSMSPKLSSSTPWKENMKNTGIDFNEKWAQKHEKTRFKPDIINNWVNFSRYYGNDFQLKYVISEPDDVIEINQVLTLLDNENILPSDICLMPEGIDIDSLNKRTSWMLEEAIKHGWRFTPRLHINLFGKNRYV